MKQSLKGCADYLKQCVNELIGEVNEMMRMVDETLERLGSLQSKAIPGLFPIKRSMPAPELKKRRKDEPLTLAQSDEDVH